MWSEFGMCAIRVPEECPQEVVDLYLRCISSAPTKRPEAAGIVDYITKLPRPPGMGRFGLKLG